MDGVDIVMEVDPEVTVDKLKQDICCHLFGASDCAKKSLYHRLLNVETGLGLDEAKTLASSGLNDQDEVLLIIKRKSTPALDMVFKTEDRKEQAVNADMITKATQNVYQKNAEREPKDSNSPVDFQAELRKILISLIDAAQKILCLNPEASKIFEDAETFIEQQKSEEPKVDEESLMQLIDMGFTRERASQALTLNRMSTTDAIQWMLEHEAHSQSDTVISSQGSAEQAREVKAEETKQTANAKKLAMESGPQKLVKMLESFRAYRRREFKPNENYLKNLIEMGFDKQDAIDALRINNNREEEACEWLLGGNNKGMKEEDFEEGLDVSSPVYKAILANPVVQLGLSNPRSLIAFLHMLENSNCTQQWLNDADTGPMLIQISRIYHAEKHAPSSSSVNIIV